MQKNTRLLLNIFATLVLVVPLIIWWQSLSSRLFVDLYTLFPLFGLLAFSLMYLQIASLVLGRKIRADLNNFSKLSGVLALLLIIIHPLLLYCAQYQNGFGLPISSAFLYVGPQLKIYVIYGMIAWVIFILTQLAAKLKNTKIIQNNWRWIEYVNYLGFYLVFWHSINLGQHLDHGALHYIWWTYALTSIMFLGYYISMHD